MKKLSTPRSQRAETVRLEILDAAMPFLARGFDAFAIKDIATAAGHKHSLVMYYFSTKERLWEQAAGRLIQRFDSVHRGYFGRSPLPVTDRDKVLRLLLAFTLSLRDLPAYGRILLTEGAVNSPRLRWLHDNCTPSAFHETRFENAALARQLEQVTLLRNAIVGAILYTVVAAPQIALSSTLAGTDMGPELYPISDAVAQRLAQLCTDILFTNLG